MPASDDPRVDLLRDLADPTRLGILELLEQAPMTATALARQLDVSATQLANHLRRLRDAHLVTVEHHSRLATYALAEPGLREIFSMLNGLRERPDRPSDPPPDSLRCYDHLAGRLGVALFDYLVSEGALKPRRGQGTVALGPAAIEIFQKVGVKEPLTAGRRLPAYACLDSTLRRPHLGGQLGAQLVSSFQSRGWIQPAPEGRGITLTDKGRDALIALGVRL